MMRGYLGIGTKAEKSDAAYVHLEYIDHGYPFSKQALTPATGNKVACAIELARSNTYLLEVWHA